MRLNTYETFKRPIDIALVLLTAPLWLLFLIPGWIAWALISLWFLYRIVRGMLAMSRQEPLPA